MMTRASIRVMLVCGMLSASCMGQTYTPPPPPLTTLPPCPVGKDGKPLKKKQKGCDPTVYPPEKVESKDKKSADAGSSGAATPATVATPAAQQFPFPGEQPAKAADTPAAKAFPYPGESSAPGPGQFTGQYTGGTPQTSDVQHDPAAEKKAAETPAGKAFPFPGGGTPDMPADPDMPAAETKDPSTPASSSSSSSSSPPETGADSDAGANADRAEAPGPKGEYDDDDSTAPKLKDRGSEGRHGKNAVKPPQTDTERVDEDLSVAKFYGQSGNKMGAYLRAKDAVKTQPDYPEAHFVLGQAAQRLGKNDEALAEFTEYLKLAPDGERAKSAKKALEELH